MAPARVSDHARFTGIPGKLPILWLSKKRQGRGTSRSVPSAPSYPPVHGWMRERAPGAPARCVERWRRGRCEVCTGARARVNIQSDANASVDTILASFLALSFLDLDVCGRLVSESAVLSRRLGVMTRLAECLPVVPVPEENPVSAMWNDVVHDRSRNDFSLSFVLSTEGMLLQPSLASLIPT